MNALWLISEHGWRIAGWTMVYFLAIGSLAAIVASGLRLVQRNAPPTLRYATSLAVFAILAILPAGIAIWLYQSTPAVLPLAAQPPAAAPAVIDLAIEPVVSPVEHRPLKRARLGWNLTGARGTFSTTARRLTSGANC
jgi:hypothetical protein